VGNADLRIADVVADGIVVVIAAPDQGEGENGYGCNDRAFHRLFLLW
jgi:hypothetical protein